VSEEIKNKSNNNHVRIQMRETDMGLKMCRMELTVLTHIQSKIQAVVNPHLERTLQKHQRQGIYLKNSQREMTHIYKIRYLRFSTSTIEYQGIIQSRH
jgi:hypothetical protein